MIKIIKAIANFLFCHFFYQVTYKNLNRLEEMGQCIICPNHSHIFDPVWIYVKTDHLYTMAKSELFQNKLLGKIFKYFGAFPVKREKYDTKSTRQAIEILEESKENKLLLFPEGGIIKNNRNLRKVKNGAAFLAAQKNVPILPVSITENPPLFSKVVINFKEPIKIEANIIKNKALLKETSKKLFDIIYEKED